MAALIALVAALTLILTAETEAQSANGTLPMKNVTVVELAVNLTTAKPELPPGGLPEVIVEPAKATNSTPPPLVVALPPLNNTEIPAVETRQMEEGGLMKPSLVVDPDAFQTKVLGSKCKVPKDCISINNTSCISGICDCISGFIPSKHSLEKCVKVPAGLGDACEEEAQCSHVVAASECRAGLCDCPPNFVFDLSKCWEKQLLGGMCNTSAQCDNVQFSLCAQGVCTCQSPLIPSPNDNKCLPAAGNVYRAQCEEDIQCTFSYGDEAHCSNSQCVCTNNYHFNGTTCISDKKLGDSCTSDADCEVSDVNQVEGSRACISEVCSCADGFMSLFGEDICTEKSSAEELAVSLTWISCIVVAKFYLS